jgi:hypothetical protein
MPKRCPYLPICEVYVRLPHRPQVSCETFQNTGIEVSPTSAGELSSKSNCTQSETSPQGKLVKRTGTDAHVHGHLNDVYNVLNLNSDSDQELEVCVLMNVGSVGSVWSQKTLLKHPVKPLPDPPSP